jgi:FMN reductase
MRDRTLAVVSAGLSQPSSTRLLADRLGAAAVDELSKVDIRAELRVVEVRNHAHDVMNHLLTGFASAGLQEVLDTVGGSDGLIVVTPIFSASYSGLFKSFFDVFDTAALADKPVIIAATGGTARHSLALEHAMRPLLVYLRAVVVPTSVFAAAEDWAAARGWPVDERTQAGDEPPPESAPVGEGALHDRIRQAARELAAQMALRDPATVADPFALTTTFDDLIAGP